MKSTFLLSVISLIVLAFFDINQVTAEGIEFAYVGKLGPNFWNLLTPESDICATGKKQSPIDITTEDLKMLADPPNPKFCDAKNVKSTNNGNTVEISSCNEEEPLPAEITVDGELYKLQQFHFHTPSEHRINEKHFDIEQHLVFQSESKKISVVAVFYDVGKEDSAFMAPIVDNLPIKSKDVKYIKQVDLKGLLSDIDNVTKAYTYSGSLTTPPCTEGVTWYVNKNALQISTEQFLKLRKVIGFNSRFTQLREEVVENNNNQTDNQHYKRSLYNIDRFRK